MQPQSTQNGEYTCSKCKYVWKHKNPYYHKKIPEFNPEKVLCKKCRSIGEIECIGGCGTIFRYNLITERPPMPCDSCLMKDEKLFQFWARRMSYKKKHDLKYKIGTMSGPCEYDCIRCKAHHSHQRPYYSKSIPNFDPQNPMCKGCRYIKTSTCQRCRANYEYDSSSTSDKKACADCLPRIGCVAAIRDNRVRFDKDKGEGDDDTFAEAFDQKFGHLFGNISKEFYLVVTYDYLRVYDNQYREVCGDDDNYDYHNDDGETGTIRLTYRILDSMINDPTGMSKYNEFYALQDVDFYDPYETMGVQYQISHYEIIPIDGFTADHDQTGVQRNLVSYGV